MRFPRLAGTEKAIANHPLLAALYPLAKQSMVYMAGAVLIGMGYFVLVPLYTRYLTPRDFGAYALIEISLLITVTTTQMGLGTTYLRWYAETEASRRGEILASCVAGGIVAAALGGGILAAVMDGPLGRAWIGENARAAWIFLPLVLIRTAQGIFFSSLQAAQRPVAYVLSAVTRLLMLVTACYWFVALHGERVRGVLNCWLTGDGVCLLILMGFCLPGMKLRVRKSLLIPMLRYGFPLVWSSLMALLLDASGRYFLAQFQSLAEVGRYTVGIKVTSLLSMGFLRPFGSAWAGAVFPIAHRPNAAITYTKIMGYALLVATLLAAITILFGPLLIRILAGRAYAGAQSLLPWLLLPVVFRFLEYWSSLPIYLKYKTQWLGPLATVGTALCIVLNYFLVPRLGAQGAAIAWAGALAATITLMTVIGRRYYRLPFDLRTCGFAAGVWALAIGGSRVTSSLSTRAGWGTSIAAAVALLAACLFYFFWDVRASKSLFKGNAYAAD
ncbi:MAG TPA: oligosaccharide flippase family protein [Candidatus Acidoferrum sp.]|nr:oligosaccharide flippase family protein [Candidatus Acidoferrum sp.]